MKMGENALLSLFAQKRSFFTEINFFLEGSGVFSCMKSISFLLFAFGKLSYS